jgi:hypothetical protein
MNSPKILIALATVLVAACSAQTPPNADDPSTQEGRATEAKRNEKDSTPKTAAPGGDDTDEPKAEGDLAEAAIGGCDTAPPSSGAMTSELVLESGGRAAPAPQGGAEKGTGGFTGGTAVLPATAGAMGKIE